MSGYLKACRILAIGFMIGSSAPTFSLAQGDGRAAVAETKDVGVEDPARIFSANAIEEVVPLLEKANRETGIPTKIETVRSLEGKTIGEASRDRVKHLAHEGIYILLAKEERKIEVRVAQRYKGIVTDRAQSEIRDAIVGGLGKGEPDLGLRRGGETIVKVLGTAPKVDHEPLKLAGFQTSGSMKAASSSLIIRNQVRLTLAGARRIVEGAEKKAAEMGLKVNIAVVDDGGHLLNFARMDGARPASIYTATTKAVTAATFRQATGPLGKPGAPLDVHLNLSLQNAASASGGTLTTLFGGVPVVIDSQVIGGVGVGGGTGEQDAEVSKAGIEAFLAELRPADADSKHENAGEK